MQDWFFLIVLVVSMLGTTVDAKKVLKIGHRGACGHEAENTISSFKKALEIGVDVVEFDVHKCKSGELVVVHDCVLKKQTDGDGHVQQKTFKELQQLRVKGSGKIPTLQQVLDTVDKKIMVNIEVKDPQAVRGVAQVIQEYVAHKGWSYQHFLVSSFNHHAVKKISELCPKVHYGPCIASIPLNLARVAQELGAHFLTAHSGVLTQELVDDAHKRGVKVFVYTVNEKCEIDRMKQMGVDGIFSDYPDRL